jgi:inner membrane protein
MEIPRAGDSEESYHRTLAYLYLDADHNGSYERLFNRDLLKLGYARVTTFSHVYRREFERLREGARKYGIGLWGSCPATTPY